AGPRAPGSGIRARRSIALGIMATFVKATQAYQQGQRTLPRRYYVDPAIYGEEQERIFARRWVCAGRAAELDAPGAYVVRSIAGESGLVVRGQGGEVRANWKLVFQNFSGCLHCPVIHPGLAKLTPYTSGENDLFEGPYLGGYMVITAPGGSLTLSGRACGPAVGELPAEDRNRVYFYTIFPNLLLSLHPDYVMFHTLRPEAPDRTHITCEWLFHADAFGQPGFDPQDAVGFWDETNRQDWNICERSQLGVASRAYE